MRALACSRVLIMGESSEIMVPGFLPWQTEIAARWLRERERFAHAWLIHGLSGIGKRHFALAAAAALLCEQQGHQFACGACNACRWMASGNHPDFRRVRPEAVALEEGEAPEDATGAGNKRAPSREIRVEQLRALTDWYVTATHRGGWRVVAIYPADAMNHITANTLLKVLEEPPPRTVFLLTSDAPALLLPTILSRCRRLPLPIPSAGPSVAWLAEQGVSQPSHWLAAAGGAPMRALQLAQAGDSPCPAWLMAFLGGLANAGASPAALAAQGAEALNDIEPALWIDALQRAFLDISLIAASSLPRYFPGQAALLTQVAAQTSPPQLAGLLKWLNEQRKIATHPLSARLFAQAVLQRCAQACRSTSSGKTA